MGVWFTYSFFIKEYETADEEVDNIVDTEFNVQLPVDSPTNDPTENGESIENFQKDQDQKSKQENNEQDLTTKPSQEDEQSKESVKNKEDAHSSNGGNQPSEQSTTNKDSKQASSKRSPKNDIQEEQDTTTNDSEHKKAEHKRKNDSATEDTKNVKEQDTTAEDIIAHYKPSFEALQSQALSKLNLLVSYAHNEYKGKKNRGEKVSYGYFYNKYKEAAEKLEAKTDATFQQLYSSLQKELAENGFSKSKAQKIKDYYSQKKRERESQMLSKVLEKF